MAVSTCRVDISPPRLAEILARWKPSVKRAPVVSSDLDVPQGVPAMALSKRCLIVRFWPLLSAAESRPGPPDLFDAMLVRRELNAARAASAPDLSSSLPDPLIDCGRLSKSAFTAVACVALSSSCAASSDVLEGQPAGLVVGDPDHDILAGSQGDQDGRNRLRLGVGPLQRPAVLAEDCLAIELGDAAEGVVDVDEGEAGDTHVHQRDAVIALLRPHDQRGQERLGVIRRLVSRVEAVARSGARPQARLRGAHKIVQLLRRRGPRNELGPLFGCELAHHHIDRPPECRLGRDALQRPLVAFKMFGVQGAGDSLGVVPSQLERIVHVHDDPQLLRLGHEVQQVRLRLFVVNHHAEGAQRIVETHDTEKVSHQQRKLALERSRGHLEWPRPGAGRKDARDGERLELGDEALGQQPREQVLRHHVPVDLVGVLDRVQVQSVAEPPLVLAVVGHHYAGGPGVADRVHHLGHLGLLRRAPLQHPAVLADELGLHVAG
eukprot:scaffold18425_cov112-Isochrysis_galbana.AAC.7